MKRCMAFAAPGPKPNEWVPCGGEVVQGPFRIVACLTYEEPTYYPPSGSVAVEHCTACGALYLPEAVRGQQGSYVQRPGAKLQVGGEVELRP